MVWLQALVPAALAAAGAFFLTPVARRLAAVSGAIDRPGGRKRHPTPLPRLGGVAIVGGILLALGPTLVLLLGDGEGFTRAELLGFGLATLIVFVLGLCDDIFVVGPLTKLLVQIVTASIIVGIGWEFSVLRLPGELRFTLGAIAPILSVVWIVGVTNAINLIDGLDGLAAGITAIISGSLLVLAILHGKPETVIATSCILGACVGFLRHNWRPASIYMGDSGSLTLGFILAAMTLRSSAKASATVAILVPILALGLPVIDTLLVMWYRFLRGHPTLGRLAGVFHGDRKHVHHLLLETRVGHSRVVLLLYGLVLVFCLMALVVAVSRNLQLGIAFLVIEFLAISLIRKAGLTAQARHQVDESLASIRQGSSGDGARLQARPANTLEEAQGAEEGDRLRGSTEDRPRVSPAMEVRQESTVQSFEPHG